MAPVGMLTTRFAGGLRARPLEARADRDAGIIWFVTDVRGAKDDEIDAADDMGLVFIDADGRAYLSITGRASETRDAAKAKEIWKKTDDLWLPGGPNDPNARVLRVEPLTAEVNGNLLRENNDDGPRVGNGLGNGWFRRDRRACGRSRRRGYRYSCVPQPKTVTRLSARPNP